MESNRKQYSFKIEENEYSENKLSDFRTVWLHVFSLKICHYFFHRACCSHFSYNDVLLILHSDLKDL